MIVKGMDYKEILKESKEDYIECGKRAATILSNNKSIKKFISNAKKSCQLNKQPPIYFFNHFTITSKNKNIALIIPGYNTKLKDIVIFMYILYNFGSGYYAVLIDSDGNDSKVNRIYTPHFFDRFRERELKNIELSKFEVISEFSKFYYSDTYLMHTILLSSLDLPENILTKFQKYPKESYLEPYGESGLMIFERFDNNTLIMKTYLSLDILKEDQKLILKDLMDMSKKVNINT